MKYKNLPDTVEEKIIPSNFGHIGHLAGSKMIDNQDKLLSKSEQDKFTVCKRDKDDIVIITEKIDGMNSGVVKKNGMLYPINRKGYDVRTMCKIDQLRTLAEEWAIWVDEHYKLYYDILEEGERLAFENAIMMHTLKYKFKHEPVFLLAKYTSDNKKINYDSLTKIAQKNNIQQVPLLNYGVAIDPITIIKQYPKGCVGVRGEIEGVVYNYEHNGIHESCGKYVSNKLMGTTSPMTTYYNIFKK